MIVRAPIINASSILRLSQDSLERAYVDHHDNTFKVYNAIVYQILSKMFTDTNAFVYMKQSKATQYGQTVFFDIHKRFLGPDHVARQAPDAEEKL